jgi:hypothetical protein
MQRAFDGSGRDLLQPIHQSDTDVHLIVFVDWNIKKNELDHLSCHNYVVKMKTQRNHRRGNLTVAIVAAFIALAGQAVILFDDFDAANNPQVSGSARMVTAAAVSMAGAREIWPQTAGRPGSE